MVIKLHKKVQSAKNSRHVASLCSRVYIGLKLNKKKIHAGANRRKNFNVYGQKVRIRVRVRVTEASGHGNGVGLI